MVYTFKDIDLSSKHGVPFALKKIHGIGLARANYICAFAGLASSSRVGFLNSYEFFVITFLLKQYYGTDVFLRRMRENRLKEFLSYKSYKSIRFAAGLPIRGQHTHNNAKTAKQLKVGNRKIQN